MDFINILGIFLTALSLIYAFFENRRRAKLVDYNREHAWEIYRLTTKVLQHLQELQDSNEDKTKSLISITKGEAAAQVLIVDTIRMIKRFEKKFDSETIDIWFKNERIPNESHVKAFKEYTN